MGISSTQRTNLRRQFETLAHREPVELKTFRELLRRAPVGAWMALVRSNPIAPGQPATSATRDAVEAPQLRFGLYLVDPAAARVEALAKARGGPRQWNSLDSLADFVGALLESTGLKGRISVHVI